MFLRQAEDWAQLVALGQTATVPYGSFPNCLLTANYNPTGSEPREFESKYFAPGIGFVLETKPPGQRVELIAIERE